MLVGEYGISLLDGTVLRRRWTGAVLVGEYGILRWRSPALEALSEALSLRQLDRYVVSRTNVSYRTQQYRSSETPAVLVGYPGIRSRSPCDGAFSRYLGRPRACNHLIRVSNPILVTCPGTSSLVFGGGYPAHPGGGIRRDPGNLAG